MLEECVNRLSATCTKIGKALIAYAASIFYIMRIGSIIWP